MIAQGCQDWELYKSGVFRNLCYLTLWDAMGLELHSKSYADEDEEHGHMLTFLANQQKASQHNRAFARGEASFLLDAWNHLADLPLPEYRSKLHGC